MRIGKSMIVFGVCAVITTACMGALSSAINAQADFNVNYIKKHGWLRVEGTKIADEHGQILQLKGLSSHGLSWYPEYISREAIRTTKEHGANVFRAAMYTDEGMGYTQKPEKNRELLYQAIDNSLREGMYVICDWHVLKDRTPMTHLEAAKGFFEEVSDKYKNEPGVIYEIVNEPNGGTKWKEVKEYADIIIPIIRKNSPNSLIIVGTPDHCANLEGIAENPLKYQNVMYSMHKYFNLTKYKPYSTAYLKKLLDRGLPIFVSEWGIDYGELDDTRITSDHDDRLNFQAAEEYAAFLRENDVSWCYWSLSNKEEAHSAIVSSSEKLSDWEEEDLSPSVKFVFGLLENQ